MRLITAFATSLALISLSTAAKSQVIHGCIKSNGTLKIADACGNNETPISWNVQGPQGDIGDPGMDGVPGSDAEVLRVFDVNGRELGLLVAREGNSSPTRGDLLRLYVPGIGEAKAVARLGRLEGDPASFAFEGPGCTGQSYTNSSFAGRVILRRSFEDDITVIWVGDVGEPARTVTFASEVRSDGSCSENVAQVAGFIPATEITADDLGLPWPGPLYVGLPAE